MSRPGGNPDLKPGPGRPKGLPNKVTRVVKELLADAFDELGGLPAFVAWGRKNPTEFYKLWAKLLPTQLTGDRDNPLYVASPDERARGQLESKLNALLINQQRHLDA
jgi:hypothetical protein